MLNFTHFDTMKSPEDIISIQASAVRTALAYVPVESLRTQLSTMVDLNEAFAKSMYNALFTYTNGLKSSVKA